MTTRFYCAKLHFIEKKHKERKKKTTGLESRNSYIHCVTVIALTTEK